MRSNGLFGGYRCYEFDLLEQLKGEHVLEVEAKQHSHIGRQSAAGVSAECIGGNDDCLQTLCTYQ